MLNKNRLSTIILISSLILVLLVVSYFNVHAPVFVNDTTAIDDIKNTLLKDIKKFNDSKNEFQEYVENTKSEFSTLQQELISAKEELVQVTRQTKNEKHNPQPIKLSDAELKQQKEVETNQVLVRADNMILTEEVDTQWSGYAEAELTAKFESSELSNIDIVDIECRSTLCKMNVNVISPSSQIDTYQAIYLSMPWDGTAAVQIAPDGSNALIYMSREGYDLTPTLPEKF